MIIEHLDHFQFLAIINVMNNILIPIPTFLFNKTFPYSEVMKKFSYIII